MNKSLQKYFENTKSIHILLTITLLMIIGVMVLPNALSLGPSSLGTFLRLCIITLLSYILFRNFSETYQLTQSKLADVRENTVASYVLCSFIFILLVYVVMNI
jgi:hypothetical protein